VAYFPIVDLETWDYLAAGSDPSATSLGAIQPCMVGCIARATWINMLYTYLWISLSRVES